MTMSVENVLGQYVQIDVPTHKIISELADQFDEPNNLIRAIDELVQAMIIGGEIFQRQYSPLAGKVVQTLKEVQGNRSIFSRFLDAAEVSCGTHEFYSEKKIEPDFSQEYLQLMFEQHKNDTTLPLEVVADFLFNDQVMPNLPEQRGVYPAEVNPAFDAGEMLLSQIKKHQQGKLAYTSPYVLPDGKIKTMNFSRLFKTELEQIDQLMHNSADLLEDLGENNSNKGLVMFADYLRKFSEANTTLKGKFPYTPGDIAMVRAYKEGGIPFFAYIGFGDGYSDKFGVKNMLSGEIGIETKECRELASMISGFENMQILEDNIPFAPARRENIATVPVLIQDIVFRAGGTFVGSQGIAVTYLSEDQKVIDKEGTVIAGWRNVLDAKGRHILNPIARAILPEEFVSEYSKVFDDLLSMSFAIGTMSHEQRHFIGEQMPRPELTIALGKNFNAINEGKAEIGRLYSFGELITSAHKGLSADELQAFFRQAYFSEVFRHIRFGKENPYGLSAMMRLNYFINEGQGAVTIGNDLKVQINDDKLLQANENLYKLHLQITQEGDTSAAEAFVKEFSIKDGSKFDGQVKGVLKRLDAQNIPRDIILNYQI
ncbi:MAG: hypothetical protein ISS25_03375 [Nanoarchaeota archaeon]|nr:hypothetical protein [DPANN group archaeon]MBL7116842.1 hypothetical protein [Nanoarchaeota archaeon]